MRRCQFQALTAGRPDGLAEGQTVSDIAVPRKNIDRARSSPPLEQAERAVTSGVRAVRRRFGF